VIVEYVSLLSFPPFSFVDRDDVALSKVSVRLLRAVLETELCRESIAL